MLLFTVSFSDIVELLLLVGLFGYFLTNSGNGNADGDSNGDPPGELDDDDVEDVDVNVFGSGRGELGTASLD